MEFLRSKPPDSRAACEALSLRTSGIPDIATFRLTVGDNDSYCTYAKAVSFNQVNGDHPPLRHLWQQTPNVIPHRPLP